MGNNTRRDGRVEPGQKISSAFSARAWNRAQDAADLVLDERGRFGAGPQAGRELAPNTILIRNSTGYDVPWLGVLRVGGVLIDPSGGTLTGTDAASERARQFARRPVLNGFVPAVGFETNFAVCMEPLANGQIGLAAVSGCFACRVFANGNGQRFATVIPGDVTQLQTADCGAVQLIWREPGLGANRWAIGVL